MVLLRFVITKSSDPETLLRVYTGIPRAPQDFEELLVKITQELPPTPAYPTEERKGKFDDK